MGKTPHRQAGLVKLIILIIVIVLVLSYFGINIKKIAESETGQANFGYLWNLLKSIWSYLVEFWNNNLKETVYSFWDKLPLPASLK